MRKDSFWSCLLLVTTLALGACTSALHPLQTERAGPGINSKVHNSLKEMPDPQNKVVAAVYRFRDQTGQYKPSSSGASWSTAVTQGATSILIKSMEDSGWFTPIERAGVSNLLNERQIIQKTRKKNNQSGQLPPLLFAGVLLEGGIVGYDTNVITGGGGVRMLGSGGSGQYRKDQVTIYLRAVSTSTGKILETVQTTKSIISQQLQGGAFRYIDSNRLLEAEAGFTYNEPPVMAVTEAIDEALKMLVIKGENQGIWSAQDTTAFNRYEQRYKQTERWKKRARTDYFGLTSNKNYRSGLNINTNFIYGSHIGNFANPMHKPGGALELEYFLSPSMSLYGYGQRSVLGAENAFSQYYLGFGGGVRKYFTPDHPLSPYVAMGAGAITYDHSPVYMNGTDWFKNGIYPTANAEAGFDYRFTETIGARLGFEYRYLVNHGLDGIDRGSIGDQQWNISAGITVKPRLFGKIFRSF